MQSNSAHHTVFCFAHADRTKLLLVTANHVHPTDSLIIHDISSCHEAKRGLPARPQRALRPREGMGGRQSLADGNVEDIIVMATSSMTM